MFPEERGTETHRPPLNFTWPQTKKFLKKATLEHFSFRKPGGLSPASRAQVRAAPKALSTKPRRGGGGGGLAARRPSPFCLQPSPASPHPPVAPGARGVGGCPGKGTTAAPAPQRGRFSPFFHTHPPFSGRPRTEVPPAAPTTRGGVEVRGGGGNPFGSAAGFPVSAHLPAAPAGSDWRSAAAARSSALWSARTWRWSPRPRRSRVSCWPGCTGRDAWRRRRAAASSPPGGGRRWDGTGGRGAGCGGGGVSSGSERF